MSKIWQDVRFFLTHRFNLQEDKADESTIIAGYSGVIDHHIPRKWKTTSETL